jgi:hypothetical protein
VTGKNIGFNQYVKDNIELYTVDGVPSLLADEYITMTSNAVSVASVEIPVVPGTPEVPETPEITETPEAPETPESPETPETPETPEISETPSTTETPTTSGNATGSTSGGSSGGGGSAAKPSNTMSGSASEVSVSISAAEAKKAAESGATITIPMDSLSASADTANAPTVTLSIPAEAGTVKVKIPVENATLGTVAVLVKEDGTEEIIKTTVLSDNGILVNLSGDVTVKIIDNTPDFQDVSSENPSWYRDAVNFVAARGIMSGTDANSFQPDENLSRGMIAQMLFSLENKPATSTEKSFSDVGGAWYTDAVLWAAEMGVVSGYPDGSFGANDNMTREQMAVILYGYSKMKGYDLSTAGDVSSFTDGAETSAWAKDAVEWAVGIGLMSGKDGGILDPRGTASRAEVATVFMNYCQNVAQ